MALSATAVSVSTTAVALTVSDSTDNREGHRVAVTNTGSATVYLGPAGVTSATGFPLDAAAVLAVDLEGADRLFGICAAGTSSTVRVLQQGV